MKIFKSISEYEKDMNKKRAYSLTYCFRNDEISVAFMKLKDIHIMKSNYFIYIISELVQLRVYL